MALDSKHEEEKRMKARNIIFDLGNVLVELDFDRSMKAFRQLGVASTTEQEASQLIWPTVQKAEVGEITTPDICEGIRQAGHIQAGDTDILQAWNAMLVDIADERKQKLLELHQHHHIFLLSNTNLPHWTYCSKRLFPYRQWGVNDYFNKVFLSYEMHLAKPAEEIFTETLRQADIEAADTLFIDDREENCQTAERLGFQTYLNLHINDWIHEDHLFE
jgi:FMN phosphatase YigB (HAD superfamily)